MNKPAYTVREAADQIIEHIHPEAPPALVRAHFLAFFDVMTLPPMPELRAALHAAWDEEYEDYSECSVEGCEVMMYIHDQLDPLNPRCDEHRTKDTGDKYKEFNG